MKKVLLLVLMFVFNYGFSQITINEGFTHQELIQNQLIGNPNFPASNFITSTGTNFGSVNGIGAFNANGADITLSDGIVLSTGNVASIPGTNTTTLNEGVNSWPGDLDLEIATGTSGTYNASFLQFDFVAQAQTVSMEFLMASEEYGNFECAFGDTFAFLLSDSLGTTTNIAVVPGTTTPISVVNVRNGGGSCLPSNSAYFDRYNYDASGSTYNPDYILEQDSPINFNGQTKVFMLMGNLVVGNNYTIKIVIADALDTVFDSALFIKNSSFGIVPVIEQEPNDIVEEDTDNNGSSVFNLRINETQMLGSIDTNIYAFDFNYYTTLIDAETQVNSIANPEVYTNSNALETIFVNMKNAYTGTFVTGSFKIATSATLLNVDGFNLNDVDIYPIPVTNTLFINNEYKSIIKVEIYNIQGQLVTNHIATQSKNIVIAFESYLKGVYLVKLISKDGETIRRIIK